MNLKSIDYEAESGFVRHGSLIGPAKVLLAFFMVVAMLAPAAVGSQSARADEGMWLVNAISRSLERKMKDRGLKIDAGMIYDEDSASLSGAIVSLDFGCTGSIISKSGLLITNHHCAFSDLHELRNPGSLRTLHRKEQGQVAGYRVECAKRNRFGCRLQETRSLGTENRRTHSGTARISWLTK